MRLSAPALALAAGALLVLASLPASVSAQGAPPDGAAEAPTPVEAEASVPPPTESPWEGAIGLIVGAGPEYLGSDKRGHSLTPAFYLRYGRYSISNSGGFANRRSDDVFRGLGVDLIQREDLRANLTLRVDRGRQEDSSDALNGTGDVPETLRLRAGLTKYFGHGWRAGVSLNIDALGRGAGYFGDGTLSHENRWSPDTVATATAGLTVGGERYMHNYFGVTPEQSVHTGYPAYEPGYGLRDVSIGYGLRTEFGPHWTGLAGLSATRVIGPAADSPLTKETFNWGWRLGLAWRF